MSILNARAHVLRSRPTVQATGAASSAVDTTYASMSTGALAGGAPPAAGVLETSNQMMTMLYPSIMAELGMDYIQVGILSAICSVLNSICQGAYGFLTPFFSRCKLLGFGNLGIALGTLMSGLAGSYPMMIVARGVASVGSSAQHP